MSAAGTRTTRTTQTTAGTEAARQVDATTRASLLARLRSLWSELNFSTGESDPARAERQVTRVLDTLAGTPAGTPASDRVWTGLSDGVEQRLTGYLSAGKVPRAQSYALKYLAFIAAAHDLAGGDPVTPPASVTTSVGEEQMESWWSTRTSAETADTTGDAGGSDGRDTVDAADAAPDADTSGDTEADHDGPETTPAGQTPDGPGDVDGAGAPGVASGGAPGVPSPAVDEEVPVPDVADDVTEMTDSRTVTVSDVVDALRAAGVLDADNRDSVESGSSAAALTALRSMMPEGAPLVSTGGRHPGERVADRNPDGLREWPGADRPLTSIDKSVVFPDDGVDEEGNPPEAKVSFIKGVSTRLVRDLQDTVVGRLQEQGLFFSQDIPQSVIVNAALAVVIGAHDAGRVVFSEHGEAVYEIVADIAGTSGATEVLRSLGDLTETVDRVNAREARMVTLLRRMESDLFTTRLITAGVLAEKIGVMRADVHDPVPVRLDSSSVTDLLDLLDGQSSAVFSSQRDRQGRPYRRTDFSG